MIVDPDEELDLAGPQIIFTRANIHIESGQGSTYDESGLGNLIIGYNEFPMMGARSDLISDSEHLI